MKILLNSMPKWIKGYIQYTISMESTDSIVNSVIKKFAERSKVGQEKYGTTLDRTDLKTLDWIQHAQEELMDGILYLEKLKTYFSPTS